MSLQSIHLRRLVVSAVFLAIALTLRVMFSFYIPLFGDAGMRVGIAGIFSMMPSILFGPLFGGLTSGLMDVLGFMLRPSGTYLPLMTVTAVMGGVVRGGMWLFLRKRNPGKMRAIVGGLSIFLIASGAANWLMLRASGVNAGFYGDLGGCIVGDTDGMFFIARWLIERTQDVSDPAGMLASMITTVVMGLIGAGVFGLLLVIADLFLSAKLSESSYEQGSIMPLLLAMLIGSWLVNTLNTIVMREMLFTSWQVLPFVVVWLPRIIQTTITTTVYVYFIAFLLGICKKQKALQPLIR